MVKTGDVVEGRYRIIKTLGEGGMGTVFLAEHALIKRRVAIKILHPELATDANVIERFMNEARAAGTLGHPNIVESTDMGFTHNHVPYIVFEYLEGSLLTDEIYRVGGLPVRRAVRIAVQITSALHAAHNAGIVHRDLKSDNVFLTDKDDAIDHVKVLDFGISRFLQLEDRQRSMVMGTPEFMAPEQITDPSMVDCRADIYALGVMIYRLLTGRPVVTPRDAPAMMLDVVFRMPARPSDFIAITAEVEAVLAIALAKRPADRFANIRELADALADAASRPMPELVARGAVLLARTPWGSWAAEDTAPRIERKMDCPDNDDLTALLDGVLASDRQAAVEAHVAACAACRAVLGELVALAGTDDTAPA